MAEERKPKKPANSNASRDWEAASESDVEKTLAQAAKLASELAGEIDPAPEDERASDRLRGDDPLQNIEKGLDAELGELEQLVGHARVEVGNDAATGDQTRTEGKTAVVPDFMSEFTSPPPTEVGGAFGDVGGTPGEPSGGAPQLGARVGASGATADAKPPVPIKAGAVKTSTASANAAGPPAARIVKPGVVGIKATVTGSPDKQGNSDATKGPSLDPGAAANPADVSHNSAAAEEQSVRTDTLLLKLCEHGVQALERIDRPLPSLDGKVRHIVGLIAISILIMSVVVFIISMM